MSGGFRPARRLVRGSSRAASRPASRRPVMARPAGGTTQPHPPQDQPVRSLRHWVGPAVIGALVLLAAVLVLFGTSPGTVPQTPEPTAGPTAVSPTGSPISAMASPRIALASPGSALSRRPTPATPTAPTEAPTEAPIERPIATLRPAASGTPGPANGPSAAPGSAAAFERDGQAIAIGFPLGADARYRYRDTFLDRRAGAPDPYNHVLRRGGKLVRAHDGTDIYARLGTPVLAPFDGVVIDPAERWQPWDPDRYGLTAVIVSVAPASEGYAALMAHLDQLWVEPGQRVRQGEVIGTVGNTGNAELVRPHIHFELRAPFRLTWQEAGQSRSVDAFNPYPSLVGADPKRRP
jgi:murein DD-endopeptidase MepM/ murein hydrolase activator NlpD